MNLVVEYLNKRHNITVTPLQTLSEVVQETCNRIQPSPNPSSCKLLLKGKVQDHYTPIRLLNLPSGTKLVLSCGGPTASAGDQPAPAKQHTNVPRADDDIAESNRESNGPSIEKNSGGGANERHGAPESSENEATAQGFRSVPGVPRELCVYHRDELLRNREDADWDQTAPDSFYEFTAEDYFRTEAEHKAVVERQEMGFRISAKREQEEMERAARLGPVNIRLIYPSGMICQARFQATEKVGVLYDFAASITECGRAGIVLYTAPPRLELKNEDISLYKAKLVPAANVHIGAAGKQHSLHSVTPKDEVICLREAPPFLPELPKKESPRVVPNPPLEPSKPRKEKKNLIPKWLKLGK